MYNVLFITIIVATSTQALPSNYYMYKAGGDRYAYANGKVCRLFEEDQTNYLQVEDAYALEHSQPTEVSKSLVSCPYKRELCFRSENYSFVLLRETCSNRSKLIKGPFEEIHFLLNYDLIRYDIYTKEIYVLIQPELYVCRLDQFLRVLDDTYQHNQLPVDLKCHRQIHVNFTSKWQDFQVSNGLLIYMIDRQIYEVGYPNPLMSSSSDAIPFVIFLSSITNSNPTGFLLVSWWHTLWYVLEITILLLLVYLCRVQVRRTNSGSIFISPPTDGPYKETVVRPLVKV